MKWRILSVVLTLSMVLSMLPVTAWAEAPEDTGLCPHHTEHMEECGYIPASWGTPCAHVHTEDCQTEVVNCVHVHADSCYSIAVDTEPIIPEMSVEDQKPTEDVQADACGHVCTIESGCVTLVENCVHAHDEVCGYAEPTDGAPCTYVCDICAGLADETEAPEDVEEADLAVEEVQALIDALPAVEDVRAMDKDGQRAAYGQTQTVYDAYMALTEEQRGLVTGAGVFEELFAFFNGQVMLLATASVSYVNAQGQSQTNVTATVVESGTTTWSGSTTNGWYVVRNSVEINDRIIVSGSVNLILADGQTLTTYNGIQVGSGNSLTIWGQSGQSGKLIATTWGENAGIGGNQGMDSGSITINGGVIEATGGNYGAGIGGGGAGTQDGGMTYITPKAGTVIINGGTVTANGGYYGAGIGGGGSGAGSGGADSGTITISGGTVIATGGDRGAGIGGGGSGSGGGANGGTITITGGTVTATGGNPGAGIGGGNGGAGGNGGTITISGGTVTATGNHFGPGIGGGGSTSSAGGDGGNITISGGTITAKGGANGTGIGGGRGVNSGRVSGSAGTIRITGGTVNASGGSRSPGIGGGGGYSSDEARSGSVIISGGTITANKGNTYDMGIGSIGPMPTFGSNYNHLTFNGSTLVEWPGNSVSDQSTWNSFGTVKIVPTGGSLSVTAPTFSAVTYGYSRPSAQDISITGTATVGKVELTSGTDAFDLSSSNGSWRIQPKAGLNASTSTYSATVTATYWVGATETKATATVSFTVNKANPSYSTPNNLTATYGQTLANVFLPSGWTWDNTNTSVGNVGTNSFPATYTPSDTANYNTVKTNLSVTVGKANSTVTPSTNNATVNYGGTLTLSATVKTVSLAAGDNNVEFTVNGTSVGSAAVSSTSGGTATFTVNVTSKNGFKIGSSNTIKAVYNGSTSLNGSNSNEITVTVNPKAITGTISGTITKPYDGTTAAPADLSLTLNGIESGDNVTAASVTYTYNSADVNGANIITANVTLSGTHAGYYTLTTPTIRGTITPAPLTITPPGDKFIYNGENTFNFDMETGVNNERVTVTLTASGTDAGKYTYNENGGDHTYKVGLSSSNYAVGTAGTLTINKASQNKPTEEVKVSKASNSITVISPIGEQYEYYVGTAAPSDTDWRTSTVFTGLETGKEYTVYVRYAESTNYLASEAKTTTVKTLGADGSATLQPGESVETENGTVTNHGDHITVEDNEGNTTTVTPVPESGVEVDKDGNVAVPEGGKVKTGNGPERTLPEGGTVAGDGTVTADEIVVGNTSVKGSPVTAGPDGAVNVPKGGTVFPENGPEMTLPEGGTVNPDGSVDVPDGGKVEMDGTTVTPPVGGGTFYPRDDGILDVPDGSTVTPPGGPEITVGPDNGGTVDQDGNVKLPEGGSAQVGDTTVTVPEEGGTLEPDGEGGVEVPGGSTVVPPGGPEITVDEQGGTVDKDGNVTLPGGSTAQVGDTSVTVPDDEDGTLKPDRNGNVSVPGGSTVTDSEGNEHTVPSQGGKITSDGTYKDNAKPSTPSTGGSSSYAITVSEAAHGKVTASPTRAYTGQTVTITVTPDEGYKLSTLTVTDSRGNELTLTDKGNGIYTFIMPSRAITVTAVFTLIPPEVCDGGPNCPGYSFTDLDAHAWYHEAVDYAISHSLMNGYGNGIFGPGDTLTRAMLAQILYNLEGGVLVNYLMQYNDIPADEWYTEAVRWATSEGIVSGYGNGVFAPNDPITREQLAVMLYRYEQSKVGVTEAWMPQLSYTDITEVSDWAYDAMGWCTTNGIIEGKGNGILDPKGKATRAEVAAMLMRFLSRLFGK